MTALLRADRLVTASGDQGEAWLVVDGGRVVRTGSADAPPADLERLPVERIAGTVVPGFVDQHVHGALGRDFGSADGEGAREIAAHHHRSGSTRLVASIATAAIPDMARALRTLAPLVADGTLAGLHLEGPWLSPARRGAHRSSLLCAPTASDVEVLRDAGGDALCMVTLAPELDGAEEAIAVLVAGGVTVALGHSDCTAAEAHAAVDAGARVATHVFNGMRPLHHREPGLAGAALADDRVAVELILDGQHVARDAAEIVRRSAAGRLVLVSDAMAATGWSDGAYEIAGSAVVVADGVARLADGTSLAGSTGTVAEGFARLVREHGVPLPEAVTASSAASARALGLPGVGLGAGDRADLVVLDDDHRVTRVMRAGAWL
ncbi:N-acetylglucosamine-6-phosphate deacetylase [Clavibacter sp. B3I6]|uniref:N-acetylglucosamine-6-phosphate deacetylase n=1 Tax=Clavibacter sp. B3I6 TaxID=3042268 RepID=UPI00278850A1|nr:N-acetylglucosamine-6-phosphate deacetylase [Clavibacter sp. B3I6]MDQ0744714.1 N-acetylglucosamine-6-phosphate deacetylase [Clavibacter sp. B3I6]